MPLRLHKSITKRNTYIISINIWRGKYKEKHYSYCFHVYIMTCIRVYREKYVIHHSLVSELSVLINVTLHWTRIDCSINKLTKHFDVTLSAVIVEQMFLLTFDGTRWLAWNGFILWQNIQSILIKISINVREYHFC